MFLLSYDKFYSSTRLQYVTFNMPSNRSSHASDSFGTSMLAHKGVNIATMQLYRKSRGGSAVMVIECDQEVPKESLAWLERLEGILKVTYCSLVEE